jgi:hypothetical protein
MLGTRSVAGLAVVLGLCAPTSALWAGDTFRLDMPGRTPAAAPRPDDTRTLDVRSTDTDSDLFDVAYRGYSGYRGGAYRGYRGVYVGGHRGFGYYPRFYGHGFYRPFFYPRFYTYRYYAPFVYPRLYTWSSYYYYPAPLYVNPCVLPATVPAMPPAMTLQINPASSPESRLVVPPGTTVPPGTGTPLPRPLPPETLPKPKPSDGTFPYDGGPRDPVPTPPIEEGPSQAVPSFVIRPADRLVSLSESRPASGTGKWTFPAYGEEARRAPKSKPASR